MCESDVEKTAELKEKIETDISQILRELNAGTIDRNQMECGLKRICATVMSMPPHRK
jgi:hypothetical protein